MGRISFAMVFVVVSGCAADAEIGAAHEELRFHYVGSCAKPADPSFDPTVSGTLLFNDNAIADRCSGDSVIETYCRAGAYIARQAIACEFGCGDGACLPESPEHNVIDYGATASVDADSGAAFQAALDAAEAAGGGSVYIPAGSYLIDRTLSIGDHTELYGDGDASLLFRGPTKGSAAQWHGADNCSINPGWSGYALIRNRKYNCGNTNITLRDFKVDGQLVTDSSGGAIIALSAIENTHVVGLTLTNLNVDGIFMRNGGVNSSVVGNTITNHDQFWGNAGAIVVEMHENGNLQTDALAPLLIEGNSITTDGPRYCTGDLSTHCTTFAQCPKGVCHDSEVFSISITIAGGDEAPHVIVRDNELHVGNGHGAITCNGCSQSLIEDNMITSVPSDSDWGGHFQGISSFFPRYPIDLKIRNNTIIGDGTPGDRSAIVVSNGEEIRITDNLITNRTMQGNWPAIQLLRAQSFFIGGNRLYYVDGSNGIDVGECSVETGPGAVNDNVVFPLPSHPNASFMSRHTTDVLFESNSVLEAVLCAD